MKNFTIHIDSDSYVWKNGKVDDFGKIYVQLDEYDFPHKSWTDFGRTIVGWWMQSFSSLLNKEKNKVECDFMDGSYRFDITALDSKKWKFEFVKEKAESEEILHEGEADADQATESLLEAVEKIIQLYQKEGNTKAVNNYNEYKRRFISDWKKS